MKKIISLSFFGALLVSSSAIAADVPDFLANGKKYASDWRACVGFADGGAPDDSNTLDATGIYGYEFACTFVDFTPVKFEGRTTGYFVRASCGDDSGINRPDNFELSFYEDVVTATSQNDYLYDLLRPRSDGDGDSWGFVSTQFEMCQPE